MPIHNSFPQPIPESAAAWLANQGFLLPIEISPPQSLVRLLAARSAEPPSAVSGFALVDTGASHCCVEEKVLRQLQLQPVRRINVCSPNGSRLQFVYLARLSFPGAPIPPVELRVIGVQLDQGETLGLIGRDFLRHCLVVYNGPLGGCTLSF